MNQMLKIAICDHEQPIRRTIPKIVVRKDIGRRWYDDHGILNINLIDFLLDKELV